MRRSRKFINTISRNNEFSFNRYCIAFKTDVHHCIVVKKNTSKGIEIFILSKYRDLLNKCTPAIHDDFAWLEKPLKILDCISKLKKIENRRV